MEKKWGEMTQINKKNIKDGKEIIIFPWILTFCSGSLFLESRIFGKSLNAKLCDKTCLNVSQGS